MIDPKSDWNILLPGKYCNRGWDSHLRQHPSRPSVSPILSAMNEDENDVFQQKPSKNQVLPTQNGATRIRMKMRAIGFDFTEPSESGGITPPEEMTPGEANRRIDGRIFAEALASGLTDSELELLKKEIKKIGYQREQDPADYYCFYVSLMCLLMCTIPLIIYLSTFNAEPGNDGRKGIVLGVIGIYILFGLMLGFFLKWKLKRHNQTVRAENYQVLIKAYNRLRGGMIEVNSESQINELLDYRDIFTRVNI